jgi:hypothetical protein
VISDSESGDHEDGALDRALRDEPADEKDKKGKQGKKEKMKKGKKSKKDKKKRSKKSKQHRSSSSSSSSSPSDSSSALSASMKVFREAEGNPKGKSHADLMARARKHPGLMTSQILQQMQSVVGTDGQQPAWDPSLTPPCATAYYLRVLTTEFPAHRVRDRRETQSLCAMLDHYALGRYKEAADVATQRLKALCYSNSGGSWENAQYMELIPPELQDVLVTNSDLRTAIKEREQRSKLKPTYFWKAKGGKGDHDYGDDKGRGNGKGKKDKDKGKLGRGKGKGKKY